MVTTKQCSFPIFLHENMTIIDHSAVHEKKCILSVVAIFIKYTGFTTLMIDSVHFSVSIEDVVEVPFTGHGGEIEHSDRVTLFPR